MRSKCAAKLPDYRMANRKDLGTRLGCFGCPLKMADHLFYSFKKVRNKQTIG